MVSYKPIPMPLKTLNEISLRIQNLNLGLNSAGQSNSLQAHVNALIFEAKKPVEKRTMSVIKSSWAYVLELGKKYKLFEGLNPTNEDRVEFRRFLTGDKTTYNRSHIDTHDLLA